MLKGSMGVLDVVKESPRRLQQVLETRWMPQQLKDTPWSF